jgi:hypothetical protein
MDDDSVKQKIVGAAVGLLIGVAVGFGVYKLSGGCGCKCAEKKCQLCVPQAK